MVYYHEYKEQIQIEYHALIDIKGYFRLFTVWKAKRQYLPSSQVSLQSNVHMGYLAVLKNKQLLDLISACQSSRIHYANLETCPKNSSDTQAGILIAAL